MKKFFVILTLVFLTSLSAQNYAYAEENEQQSGEKKPKQEIPIKIKKYYSERVYVAETKDGQLIQGYLTYPKTNKKYYPTIIMLHSIGRNSKYWSPLFIELSNMGYAVLRVDFRGHGKSVFDKKFNQKSWTTFKNNTFEKYPQDVYDVIEKVQKETKKVDFSNYIIVGSDIGANTAVILAKMMRVKPKGLVLISPRMSNKGLYIPIVMTQIGDTPILAISSKTNTFYMREQEQLSKFAQGDFDVYNAERGGADMTILQSQPEIKQAVTDWITQHLKLN